MKVDVTQVIWSLCSEMLLSSHFLTMNNDSDSSHACLASLHATRFHMPPSILTAARGACAVLPVSGTTTQSHRRSHCVATGETQSFPTVLPEYIVLYVI